MTNVTAGKFGMPWHGRIHDDGSGNKVHLPNGGTIDWPHGISTINTAIKLQAPGVPPAATTPAEAAAGQSWRNYLLWQYRKSDIYHQDRVGSTFNGELVIAAWFWMPGLGDVHEIIVTRPSPTLYKVYAVRRDGGPQQLLATLTHTANFGISDIADGPGDRALFVDVKSVYEIALSIDEQGAIVMAETLIETVGASDYSTTDTSFIQRHIPDIVNTYSSTVNCGGTDYDLFTHTGVVVPVDPSQPDPDEYYEQWDSAHAEWDKIKYQNSTTDSVSESVTAALYIEGVASIVVLRTQTTTSRQWSFDLQFAYQAHDEIGGGCAIDLIVDVPRLYTDTMSYDYTASITQQVKVNGVVVSSLASSSSIHGQRVTVRTHPYDIWRERWQYDGLEKIIPYTDAQYTTDGQVTTGSWSPPGPTIGLNAIWIQIPRKLHPVWIDGTNGICIHPGGISAIAYTGVEEVNYNPNTSAVEVENFNFSYV